MGRAKQGRAKSQGSVLSSSQPCARGAHCSSQELCRTHHRIILQGKPGIVSHSIPISHWLRGAPWDQELSRTSQTIDSCWGRSSESQQLRSTGTGDNAPAREHKHWLEGCGKEREVLPHLPSLIFVHQKRHEPPVLLPLHYISVLEVTRCKNGEIPVLGCSETTSP